MNQRWIRALEEGMKKNSPAILSGAAIVGLIGTVVLAVKATPKARGRLDEIRDEGHPAILRREIVAATWKFYIPAAVAGAGTIACIVGSNRISAKRYAAIGAAYTLAETTLRSYKEHVIEEIGEAKERKIHDKMIADEVNANPPPKEVLIIDGGDVLVYDKLTGRYFKSSHEAIRRAENEFNRLMLTGGLGYSSANEWYELLGIGDVGIGEILGWNLDNPLKIRFDSVLHECTQAPCLAIIYENWPKQDYSKLY